MRRRTPGPAAIAVATCAAVVALHASPPAPARVAPSFGVPAPARTVLKNGLTLLILERRGLPLVEMDLMVPTGSLSDPAGKEGLASLTATLLSRGAGSRTADQFAEAVEFLGGSIGATAGLERTIVAGEFAARDFGTGLALLADMVRAPTFGEADVARERGLALAGFDAVLDDPEALADRAFARWLFGAHPYGRPVDGSRTSVAALTRADVVAFHRSAFVPTGATLLIAGDVEARAAGRAVSEAFGSWAKRAPVAPSLKAPAAVRGRPILLLDKEDATQCQIRLGNVAPRRGDPEAMPLRIANTVLGGGFTSWLMDEVRVKRGLTYGVSSGVVGRRAAGSLVVSTSSRNAAAIETIRLSIEQMRRMRAGGLETADLEKGRSYLAGLYPLRIEALDALASEILDVEFYGLGGDYINAYQKRVGAVALEPARAAAARWIPADDLAIVVVGPAGALKGPLGEIGQVTTRPAAWAVEGRD